VAGEPRNGVPSLVRGSPKASRRAYPGEFGGCLPRNVVSPKGRVWPGWTSPVCLTSPAGAMLLQVAHKRALSQARLSGGSTFHRLPSLNQP
jgi:hypothetical protein